MHIEQVSQLDGRSAAADEKYGSKISLISLLAEKSVQVPRGFFISHEDISDHLSPHFDNHSIDLLQQNFNALQQTSRTGKCIVRSSSSVENKLEHQFPGLFESVRNVTSFSDLQHAIARCFQARNAEKVRTYAANFGVRTDAIKTSLLIQEQIEPVISGMAHVTCEAPQSGKHESIYIELTKNGMTDLIQGVTIPSPFWLDRSRNVVVVQQCGSSGGVEKNQLNPHLNILWSTFQKVRDVLGYSVILEFGIDETGCWIYQARPAAVKGSGAPPRRPSGSLKFDGKAQPPILPEEARIGLKGAAMKLFRDAKLFNEKLLLFETGTPLADIQSTLKTQTFPKEGLTIRYSRGDEIGLERIFVRTIEHAFLELTRTYKPDYFTIIHSYMDVARSYELLLEKDYIVLEHVPGLWEANNTLEPDVAIIEGNVVTMLKFREKRQKLLASPDATKHVPEDPVKFDFLEQRIKYVHSICESELRPRFNGNFPLNFHFIETENGRINFLNIRRPHRVNRKYVRGGSFFHVRDLHDLAGWDGRTPILLRLTTERGSEHTLLEIAKELPKSQAEVFISFGYLSHPALLLREFGINIVPVYNDHDIKKVTLEQLLGNLSMALETGSQAGVKPAESANASNAVVGKLSSQTPQATTYLQFQNIIACLNRLTKISLKDTSVVGAYSRFDERIRNRLRDWKLKISAPLMADTKSNARENFLIWAAPGSGKSFFIQEIARELGTAIQYVELNLARDSKEDFVKKLSLLEKASLPTLCLLDEIDARENEQWPYEECFSRLDLNTTGNGRFVFVLIGSTTTGVVEMAQRMEKRWKGADLVSRILRDNRFEIPGAGLEDRVVVFVSQVLQAAADKGNKISEIEKLALYYALSEKEFSNPRQLRDLAFNAVQRIPKGESRLKYDHLFDYGIRTGRDYYSKLDALAQGLADIFINIKD